MRVVLIGHPVTHSLSPAIHNAAFAACALPHEYEAIDVESQALPATLAELRGENCLGANVTVPHKRSVADALDGIDEDARTTGAVNTILHAGGRLSGFNTDIEGAWKGLLEPAIDAIRGGLVMLAGAGGGARAVMVAMARSLPDGPDQVVVVARRVADAEAVADLGRRLGLVARAESWRKLEPTLRSAGVVVNCTPLGLEGEDPFEGIPVSGRAVLDLAYRAGGTPLVRRARSAGAVALQGDQMLLHQGAAAFRLWTGLEAPIEVMRSVLEREMA